MKPLHIATAVVCTLLSGHAAAICAATTGPASWQKMLGSTGAAASRLSTLSGKTVCVAEGGGWAAQEYHAANGDLIDFKLGSDRRDPTSRVGSWSVSGDQITHSYGPGASYTYDVYTNGTNYSFCAGAVEKAAATVRSGQVGC